MSHEFLHSNVNSIILQELIYDSILQVTGEIQHSFQSHSIRLSLATLEQPHRTPRK
ncbi:hypothetical protein D3C76_1547370 [compost metagenome]